MIARTQKTKTGPEWKHRLSDSAQPGETAPQIGDAGSNPDVRAGGQRDHRPTP
jgi:hypothetical protein